MRYANLLIRLSAFVLTVLLCTGLCACTGDSGDSGTTGGADTTDNRVPAEVLSLVTDGKTDYKLIYPEGASKDLLSAVLLFSNTIKNYTGAQIDFESDLLPRGMTPDSSAKEILIGLTNRPESSEAIDNTMKSGEYVICIKGNKLVIGGLDDLSTKNAVDYFITWIKSNKSLSYGMQNGTLTFSSENNYRKQATKMISAIKINGTDIEKYQIVVPAGGHVEKYIAQMFADHVAMFEGTKLPVVTDAENSSAYEIRIGKTARTVTAPAVGKYAIKVTGNILEAVSDTIFGYIEVLDVLKNSIVKYTQSEIILKDGDNWTGDGKTPADLQKTGALRVMYQNVWGYLNTDGSNPVANRSDMASQIYEAYQPDVLCLQEAGSAFWNASATLTKWLSANSYNEIHYTDGGTGNPIFYNSKTLKLLDSGNIKAQRGVKSTTWAVFQDLSSGKIFGVINSHFAANSDAGDNTELANSYRIADAEDILRATETILAKHSGISILAGGDYNCAPGSDPYKKLLGAGYVNVRDTAQTASTVTAYHGSYQYYTDRGYYELAVAASEGTAERAIDHIMTRGDGMIVHRYSVLVDRISATTSDHCPHFADITIK